MNKQEDGREPKAPAQHTDATNNTSGQGEEKQTSYDRPLDKVEGEMNNGETGLGSTETKQDAGPAGGAA